MAHMYSSAVKCRAQLTASDARHDVAGANSDAHGTGTPPPLPAWRLCHCHLATGSYQTVFVVPNGMFMEEKVPPSTIMGLHARASLRAAHQRRVPASYSQPIDCEEEST